MPDNKSGSKSQTHPAGQRGEAREIKQGDAGVGKTSAGKDRGPVKPTPKGTEKLPGVVKGA